MHSLYIIILLLLLCGCRVDEPVLMIHESHPDLRYVESNLMFNGESFSGIIFRLHDLKKDTSYRAVYKNGKKNGVERFWCAPHQLCEERLYKRGLLHGVQRQWYPNGRSKAMCTYVENMLDGKYLEWSENGVLQKELMYKDGSEYGLQRGWNVKGELLFSYEAVR